MIEVEFVEWLVRNCETRCVIYSNYLGYYWILTKDLADSWDGTDVKHYTCTEIHDYYVNDRLRKK